MIRRWLPYPGLALCLFAMWVLLTQSFSPGQVVVGIAVAAVGTWAAAALGPAASVVHDWRAAFRLAGYVAIDILRSNVAVARIILSRRLNRTAAFLPLRLELRNEHALAVLALIITATPGTAWVQFDRATGLLVIHVFDLVDEDEWIHLLRTRYEALLKAIFEP